MASEIPIYQKEIDPLLKQLSDVLKKHGFEFYYVMASAKNQFCGYDGDKKFIIPTTPIDKLFHPQTKMTNPKLWV